MKVEQIMNRNVKVCSPQDSLNKVAQKMWEEPCGAIPIVDEHHRPIGFITDRDVCMAAYTQGKPISEIRAETAMSRQVVCCQAEDDLIVAAARMKEKRTRRIPIVDRAGVVVGILSLDDLAREAARNFRGGVNEDLRNLVLEVHLAINHGRIRLHPAA